MKDLEYLDEDLVFNGEFYIDSFPSSLSNAIYMYGDNDIREILAYIECEDHGVILTKDTLYFSFNQKGKVKYEDIHSILYHPYCNYVKVNDMMIQTLDIALSYFSKLLSELSDVKVDLDLADEEKIEYLVRLTLEDLLNGLYEDVILTNDDYSKIREFQQEIELINTYTPSQKEEEYDVLNKHALEFFDALGLDSDEIDILQNIHIQHENLNQKAFDDSMDEYQQMYEGLKNGDPKQYNKMKSMAKMIGIDLDDLQNKSPQELNQLLEDLCARYNISKSQLETLSKRFSK